MWFSIWITNYKFLFVFWWKKKNVEHLVCWNRLIANLNSVLFTVNDLILQRNLDMSGRGLKPNSDFGSWNTVTNWNLETDRVKAVLENMKSSMMRKPLTFSRKFCFLIKELLYINKKYVCLQCVGNNKRRNRFWLW